MYRAPLRAVLENLFVLWVNSLSSLLLATRGVAPAMCHLLPCQELNVMAKVAWLVDELILILHNFANVHLYFENVGL